MTLLASSSCGNSQAALRGAIRDDANQAIVDGVRTEVQARRVVEKLGNAVDKLVESRFAFDVQSGGGKFEFRFHAAPEPDASPRQWFVVRDADRTAEAEMIVSRYPRIRYVARVARRGPQSETSRPALAPPESRP